jgi:hypothetical protein
MIRGKLTIAIPPNLPNYAGRATRHAPAATPHYICGFGQSLTSNLDYLAVFYSCEEVFVSRFFCLDFATVAGLLR